ncbi:MAG: ABC transporter ATP-binding protein [Oscillospiraceae bacterium]
MSKETQAPAFGGRGPMGGRGPGGGHGPMARGEKPKNFKASLGKLATFSKKHHTAVIIALLCAVSSSIFTIMGPDKLSTLTNLIISGLMTGIDLDGVLAICLTLVVFYGASALLGLTQGLIMTNTTQSLSRELRATISRKINRLPMKYFNTTSYGDVLSRVTNDVDTIGESLQRSIIQLVSALAFFLGTMFMMFRTNWVMAITAILSSLFGFALMMLIMRKSQKYFSARQKWLGKINGHIEEVYSGHEIVKTYNAEKMNKAEFDRLNGELYDCNWKSQFLSGLMMPLMNFVGNFGYVSVCVVGAALAMNGKIEFGDIVAFIIYVRLFTNPLSQMAQAATGLQSTAAASERVFEFLDAEELSDESGKPRREGDIRGEVEFKNVRFAYEPGTDIIHNFSEHILPGQKVAVVGPTGAGKTTIVSLLMRFYETDGGSILVDGVPTSDMPRSDVHSMFGMVLQDTWLFEGTIRENIAYCKADTSDEQIKSACKAVGLHHFIKSLPKGYDTVLDDKTNLSAGQKQLLTIARAMIQDAPMLILDEATSSVDTRTEILIQRAMDKLTAGRTSFVIAHRLSTIRNADKILVLKDGDVVESGNHEALMSQNGFYAELYNSQFEKVS